MIKYILGKATLRFVEASLYVRVFSQFDYKNNFKGFQMQFCINFSIKKAKCGIADIKDRDIRNLTT